MDARNAEASENARRNRDRFSRANAVDEPQPPNTDAELPSGHATAGNADDPTALDPEAGVDAAKNVPE